MTKDDVVKEIDAQLEVWRSARARSKYDDLSDLRESDKLSVLTRLAAAVTRLAPEGSQYRETARFTLKSFGATNSYNIPVLIGILQALRADYEAGYVQTVEELIHADVFGDFLDMARHLLAEGYKDPAAVLTGGVLEEHLRKLCIKNGIAIAVSGRPKKAEAMNSDLAAAGVTSKLDQKNVTAWLDLRNKSAHGKYSEYTQQQVDLLVQSIQDFITRMPA